MPQIYACYVVYNSANYIRISLSSVLPFVDKVIAVDGVWENTPLINNHAESTDGTKEICQQVCGDKLIWVDCPKNEKGEYISSKGEIASRNAYLNLVPDGDWIIRIDADEILSGNVKAFTDTLRTSKWNGPVMFCIKQLYFFSWIVDWSTGSVPTLKQRLWTPDEISKAKTIELEYHEEKNKIPQLNWLGYYGPVAAIVHKQKGMRYYGCASIYIGDKVVEIKRDVLFPDVVNINMKFLTSFEDYLRQANYKIDVRKNRGSATPSNPLP